MVGYKTLSKASLQTRELTVTTEKNYGSVDFVPVEPGWEPSAILSVFDLPDVRWSKSEGTESSSVLKVILCNRTVSLHRPLLRLILANVLSVEIFPTAPAGGSMQTASACCKLSQVAFKGSVRWKGHP